MGYKILGFTVWHGAKWYVRRKMPSRRVTTAGIVVGSVAVLAVVAAARHQTD